MNHFQKAIALLQEAGCLQVVIIGVLPNGAIQVVEKGTQPLELIGLLESAKVIKFTDFYGGPVESRTLGELKD